MMERMLADFERAQANLLAGMVAAERDGAVWRWRRW